MSSNLSRAIKFTFELKILEKDMKPFYLNQL